MLEVHAKSPSRFCDGFSRRQLLRVGCLSTMGLSLEALLSQQQAQGASTLPGFGRAKRAIMLFMWGGPAHQDTWDLKPEAPAEVRGEFLPIQTSAPGVYISEHFPHLARQADKLAIIRSVTHEDNNHTTSAHASLTGYEHPLKAENFGARDTDFPHIGSVLSKFRPNTNGLPTFVSLPEVIATTAGAVTPGQGGGFIGKRYDPFRINQHPDEANFTVSGLALGKDLTRSRFAARRDLLARQERLGRITDANIATMSSFYQQALDMVLSPKAAAAFDLDAEPASIRDRYGRHTFGQSLLLARRLIQSGVRLVTVYWHRENPTIDTTWDTHSRNFPELRDRLMPSVDRPLATLLEELEHSGLLDETLVIWNSEFGRTPRINRNGGRDHWGACNSVVMAGGGMPGGQVYGASDKSAAYPERDKVTQQDVAATIYHLLGLHPHREIRDQLNRPFPIASGAPISGLLGGRCTPAEHRPPEIRTAASNPSPFTRFLRERGWRFFTLDLSDDQSLSEWKLAGCTPGAALGAAPLSAVCQQHFNASFAYSWMAVRIAQPRAAQGVTLKVNGQSLRVEESAEPSRLLQVELPSSATQGQKSFHFEFNAPGWQVLDVAVLAKQLSPTETAGWA